MQARKLGRTEMQIMPLGTGSWAVGGSGWGPQDDEEPVVTIRRAREHGTDRAGTAAVHGPSDEIETYPRQSS